MNINTPQELVNAISAHLRKQAKCAVSTFGVVEKQYCRYRGDGGTKCGFGALIKDEFYSSELEHCVVSNPFVIEALHRSGVNPSLFDTPACEGRVVDTFCADAQGRLHDQMVNHPDEDFLIHFEEQLAEFCADYGLEVPAK